MRAAWTVFPSTHIVAFRATAAALLAVRISWAAFLVMRILSAASLCVGSLEAPRGRQLIYGPLADGELRAEHDDKNPCF
jgi:hypothetical protein